MLTDFKIFEQQNICLFTLFFKNMLCFSSMFLLSKNIKKCDAFIFLFLTRPTESYSKQIMHA